VAIPALSDGVNYQDFNCPVATISPIGANVAYYYQPGGGYGGRPYYTATANLPSQGFCDGNNPTALIPSVTHNSALLEIRQELTDALTLDVHGIYGSRAVFNPMPRGTITGATVFGPDAAGGPGSNAKTIAAAAAGEVNPFYQGNAATGMATQLIRGYSLDGLLGPGGYAKQLQTNVFALVDATWDLGGGREITVGGTVGQNVNAQHVHGVVTAGGNLTATAAEVYLALDGTTNGSGIPGTIGSPDAFGLDTSYPVSRVLTSLNAIDVWNPPGPTNRTSAGVIESIKNSDTFINANQGLQDLVAKFDGPVYDLPAGAIKIAVGGEYMHATNDEYGTAATPAGPQITNSSGSYFREGRTILSAFLEVNAPIISEEMNVPLVQSFSMDISGRYDKYTDVGSTKNPKVGFDWVPFTGLKVRGSYGTSFVAPVLHDSQRFNTQSAIYAAGNFANPIIAFNDTRPFNGGAGIAGTWVSTAASCAAGNGTVVNAAGATVTPVGGVYQNAAGCKVNFGETNVAGITSAAFSVRGGNDSVHPATGRSDEIGFDADFGALVGFEGLSLSLTYWEVNYRGLLTNIQTMNNLPQLTSFAPIGGWTPTSPVIQEFISGRPLTIAMPTTIWATFDGRLQNAYNIWENGLDFGLNYFLHTDDLGTFRFGASGEQLLRYTTQGGNGPLVDTLGGKNSPRYPSAEMQARFTVGWAMDSFSATLAMNYQHPSHGTLSRYPYNLPGPDRGFLIGPESTAVYTSGGTYHVPGFEQFNLSMNYVLPNGFAGLPAMASDGVSLSLVIDNILDSKPPFSPASANGYVNGNPIGRQIMIGIKKLF
jgi:iron complex outermembrane receptor protein